MISTAIPFERTRSARSLHTNPREKGLVDGGIRKMREVADGFMQLLAIIMVLITLAVSTAAFGQMLG